jgi:hypothetical protein
MICVDYSEAVAAFFTTREDGTPLPEAVTSGSPARQLRDACEPVAMHAVWNRTTNERLAQLGLDFLTSYVGGRGASLGDPAGAVVAAAFAWFEPGLVAALWDAARTAVAPGLLAQARDEATVASLREIRPARTRVRWRTCSPTRRRRPTGWAARCSAGVAPTAGRATPCTACGGPAAWSASIAVTATWPRQPRPAWIRSR